MIRFKTYNPETHLEKVWYDSTNIFYSECDDTPNALKTLRITFKNGQQYEYHDVDVHDYLMFRSGGIDGSVGKAFYKFIRNKYEFKKLANNDLEKLMEELNSLLEDDILKKKEQEKIEQSDTSSLPID